MAESRARVGRNEPCPCGSGKKYKQCHERKEQGLTKAQWAGLAVATVVIVGGLVLSFMSRGDIAKPSGVWSAEHGHYH